MLDKILYTIGIGFDTIPIDDLLWWLLLIITLPAWAPLWAIGVVRVWMRGKNRIAKSP